MSWIVENKEWLFSGAGLTVLSIIGGFFFKRKSNKKDNKTTIQTASNNSNNNININVGATSASPQSSETESQKESKVLYKSDVRILFIDDQQFDIVQYLKGQGWKNTSRIPDAKTLDDPSIRQADIIFVDINGVGLKLRLRKQGRDLAVKIKRTYPEKKVILYSNEEKHDIFDKDIDILDDRISKKVDPYQFVEIVNKLMTTL